MCSPSTSRIAGPWSESFDGKARRRGFSNKVYGGAAQEDEAAERRRHASARPVTTAPEPLAAPSRSRARSACRRSAQTADRQADREVEPASRRRPGAGRGSARSAPSRAQPAQPLQVLFPQARAGEARRRTAGRAERAAPGTRTKSIAAPCPAGQPGDVRTARRAGPGPPRGRRPARSHSAAERTGDQAAEPSVPDRPRAIRATGKVAPPNAASHGAAGEPRPKAASEASAASASRTRANVRAKRSPRGTGDSIRYDRPHGESPDPDPRLH